MEETYDNLITRLQQAMTEDYVAVHMQKNPVAAHLADSSPEMLIYQLGQYTLFPRHIVGFLARAYTKAYDAGWPMVAQELARNIGQEVGSDTDGLSHYELLAKGIEERTKLDVLKVQPSPATNTFVQGMIQAFDHPDSTYVLGATYATECSAVPELRIVVRGVRKLFKDVTGSQELGDKLRTFFHNHLGFWEPSHEGLLRETMGEYLQSQQYPLFEQGFHDVMKTMDTWWHGLYRESQPIRVHGD